MLGLVGIRAVASGPARVGVTLFALSYVNNLLQARLAHAQTQSGHEEEPANAGRA